jgi:hypothetical protein
MPSLTSEHEAVVPLGEDQHAAAPPGGKRVRARRQHVEDRSGILAQSAGGTRVPVISVHRSSRPAKPFAATIRVPGAATSGLYRPSRVGPWLLEMLIRSLSSSTLATVMIGCPQPGDAIEELSEVPQLLGAPGGPPDAGHPARSTRDTARP